MDATIAMNPSEIQFMQDSVCRNFQDGRSVNESIKSILRGDMSASDFPTISVILHDGKYFSFDNRRLYVFRVLYYQGKLDRVKVRFCTSRYFSNLHLSRKYTTKDKGNSIRVRGDTTYLHTDSMQVQQKIATFQRISTNNESQLLYEKKKMRPSDIRFYSDKIKSNLGGRHVNDIIKTSCKQKADEFWEIRVFLWAPNAFGKKNYYSYLNNRKLYIARALQYIGKLEEVNVRLVKVSSFNVTTSTDGDFIKLQSGETTLTHSRIHIYSEPPEKYMSSLQI